MHVIYITGLGDNNPKWQRRAVRVWKIYGITPHFFQVDWANGEDFSLKLARLLKQIDELATQTLPVGIVAVSAGASMALHAFAAAPKQIAGVVTICGKIQHPDKVERTIRRNNTAFAHSMDILPASLAKIAKGNRKKILCLYPFVDGYVPIVDQRLDGAVNKRSYSFGHAPTILVQITFGIRRSLRFLRQT